MERIKYVAVQSAVIKIDNSVDTERVYNISGNASINAEGNLISIDMGVVEKDGTQGAGFNRWSDTNMGITYQNVEDAEKATILLAVTDFINAAKTYVDEHGINI